ncbi:hypothetical protein HMPREF3034_01335 [Prevotella sp. DNF00663]|uniref:outer membrane beta-barrel protein n=1 Tax=unclassified Prevotella TaxID=2638335 RepID=UPI000513BD24|nr:MULTISPECIES: outer membrane beta-barrel protein [unclassified Prevotella]KGI59513.1 membrane protein [Prevotella sp. S7 MS 2]KXB83100.1 hypothetical protein HMPREF3034_01335 [Prevotella sp. DNF00663]
MRKKIVLMIAALLMTVAANAQFEGGKTYIGGSLTGLNMSYNGLSHFSYGLQAQAGYMIVDDLMAYGTVGYSHIGNDGIGDSYSLGVGGRYYIEQNGIFLGVNCKYKHAPHYNDLMPGVEVGYAFFLSRTVTIEPAIYYDQSFKKHSDYSTIGLKIGIGVYL